MGTKINLEDSKEFWNVDEKSGYSKIRASDGLYYKVWSGDESEKNQKKWWYEHSNLGVVAETLAHVRKDLNTLLKYIEKNPCLWSQHPIAFGIYHAFDLHLYGPPFEYMEMRPNNHGIIGLNKPKEISVIKAEKENGKIIDYELGTKRNILLTLRYQNTGILKDYTFILLLAIHELTHTICNDVRWVPEWKGGNHREPYPTYHRMMKKWARECGILK
jgi:hypothetical protein